MQQRRGKKERRKEERRKEREGERERERGRGKERGEERVLECIELSSMVDFSMGTIYLMVGYMTSGHGPLHVPRGD